jgi:DNA gyrase subunit A
MSLITEVDILDEAKENFLTYAEEVLTDRAIPAAEDGLLSAQRKILWTMEDYLNMSNKSKTKKCNAIVGSTLSTSYYHGDASCYGVLCKMSQEYLMRYPLIQGQGSLGTQENNEMVASSRYTEARPSAYADIMMNDFKKNVVPLKETYNGEFMEPVVLPALFPNAICNGRQAIGISMAHNSAPHNLTEVCNAAIALIQKGNLTVDEILTYIPGPDFPLGGTVLNKKDIKEAFATGKSNVSLKIQGDYEIDGQKIIFTTIPYRTYRNKIKEQIEKNIDVLSEIIDDFDDNSNIGQNRLVFYVKDGISPAKAINKLFALTDLQTTLSYNMNYIVNGTPKLCSMLNLLQTYINHQENVLIKATEFDKEKAEARAHILKGLIAAVDKIDEVIKLIKESAGRAEAKEKLISFLSIDDIQASAILDMKLGKLTRIDKEELVNELTEKEKFIAYCIEVLTNKEIRNQELISRITKLRDTYGDERRTKIIQAETSKDEDETAYVEPEKCVVVMTESGLIKRVPTASFRTQRRNGKGVRTQDDITSMVIRTNTIDSLMVFTDQGRMYRLLVNDIPVGNNTAKGQSVKSLIAMETDENPTVIYSIYRDTDAKYVLFTTKNGLVKKTSLDEYVKTKKKTGIAAINIKDGDELVSVNLIKDEPVVIITKNGYAIKFNSNEIGQTSRTTSGVKGINLNDDDSVITTLVVRHNSDNLAIISEQGLGKQFALNEITLQKRAGKGLMCYKPSTASGNVAAAALICDEDNILICGDKNSLCIAAKEIPTLGRASIGNQLIKSNKVKSISKV